MSAFSQTPGPCELCGKALSSKGFARVVHEDMHIRNGDLVCVHIWAWSGKKLKSKVIKPEARSEWEARGYFDTYERCKEVYLAPLAPRGSLT